MRNELGQFLPGKLHPLYKKVKKICGNCKKQILVVPSRKYCSHSCAAQVNLGNGTGKYLSGGYIYIYKPSHPNCSSSGTIAEHRIVAEKKIGRYLSSNEDVHHINGIKTDNRPENLEILSRSKHQSLHLSKRFISKGKMVQRICQSCGRTFEIIHWRLTDKSRKRGIVCSLSCAGKLGRKKSEEKLEWPK